MENEKIIHFRRMLAEIGIEMTIEQAKKAYEMSKGMIKRARKMSMEDIWNLEKVEGFSEEEKRQLAMLYMHAKEV
ncbi:MAG: hypothetical protein EBU90_28560 [Proteobacteria bacterium]|nr:hypothetical protein [Pseudomonadota bacterium]